MRLDRTDNKQPAPVPSSWWWAGLVGIVAAASLPVIGNQFRTGQVRCALDGQETNPLRQITVVERDGSRHVFCCITCTELWLASAKTIPHQVLVTDEITGKRISAAEAHYVRSSVPSNAPTGDRRHVFGRRDVADSHAKSFHGRVLTGDERPFGDLSLSTPASHVEQSDPSSEELL